MQFSREIDSKAIISISTSLSDLSKVFEKIGDKQRAELLLQEAVDLELSSIKVQACWGGPLNGQVGRAELIKEIISVMNPIAIVETGSFRGITTEWFAKEFNLPVYACEIERLYFRQTQARIKNQNNVSLLEMDSVQFLNKIITESNLNNTFFYLDAHWLKDLPLREELKIISERSHNAVVMIDDFRVPTDSGYGWDDYGHDQQLQLKILWGLIPKGYEILFPTLRSESETGERRGCCIIAPIGLFHKSSNMHADTYENWLKLQLAEDEYDADVEINFSGARSEAIIKSLRHDLVRSSDIFASRLSALRVQLSEKEQVIQGLVHAGSENRMLIENLNTQMIGKDSVIKDLVKRSEVDKSTFERLTTELVQKEAVIRELAEACTAHRRAGTELTSQLEAKEAVIQNFIQLRKSKSARNRLKQFGKKLTAPMRLQSKLGVLYQHPPKRIRIPRYRTPVLLEPVPKISIVTPSFRHGRFIENTLRSVLSQNYPDLEYVVQDGGSTDDTYEILKKFESQLSDWHSEPDAGQSQAINRGFARTSGEIMAWLNSDDLLLPHSLVCIANYFQTHPDVDVIYGDRILIDENGRQIGRWMLPGHDGEALSWADYIPQETLFWRRRIWDKAGGAVDETFQFAMDWDLLIRFRDSGAKFGHIPKFLGAFRIQSEQKTIAQINTIGVAEMDRIRNRIHGRIPDHLEIKIRTKPFLKSHAKRDHRYSIVEAMLHKFWQKI